MKIISTKILCLKKLTVNYIKRNISKVQQETKKVLDEKEDIII